MPIPLSILLFDRGTGGAPTTSNPVNLAGIAEGYEDTLSDRYGYATARISWTPSKNDIVEWARADHLLRPMVAYTPDARIAWEGFLAEIEIELGTKKIAYSLKDMANRLTVRYSTPAGGQGDSASYSSAASQALFGVKDRVINASIAASAAATNQAQTILNILAYPRSKQPSQAGTPRGGLKITLTFWGWYAALDWLLTSNTSTTNTSTSTQVAALLSSYNATNAFFSTSAANIASTGVSDTEYIEPDTTYREKLERLLSRGNSSQQPLAWGFYEGRALKVETRASATPSVIQYYESEASGQIRDAYGNVVDPWDVRPNAMALVTDLIDSPLVGAAESPLRKYVAKVSRSIRGNDVSVSLDPDDVESIESLLTSPAGGGAAGTSARQAAFERNVIAPARSVYTPADNATRYDRSTGVWKPVAGGTGVANTGTIDLGTGSISPGSGIDLGSGGSITPNGGAISNTGGGAIDLGTGSGIGGGGSSGVTTSGGTPGAIAKWASASALTNAVSGTDYAPASHNHAAADVTTGTMATARLGSGSASSTTFLSGDQSWKALSTITPAAISAAPDDAKYIVQTASSGLSAEQALGALATGILKNTTTTGVLSIAAGADLPSHTHSTADITSGIDGSGASTRLAYWSDANTLTSSSVLTFDGATLTAGPIVTTGASSGIALDERDGSGQWAIYATSSLFRIWDGAGDVVSVDTNGLITSVSDSIVLGAFTLNMDGSLRISGASASSGDALMYNGTAFVPTAPTSYAPTNAKYIVQTSDATLSAEQALASLATGMVKVTTSTGVLSSVAGTSGRITEWSDGTTIGASTLIKSGAGVLTLAAASTQTITISGASGGTLALAGNTLTLANDLTTSGAGNLTLSAGSNYTLTIPATGTAALGTGASTRVAVWSGTNTLTSNTGLLFDTGDGSLNVGGGVSMAGGVNIGSASGAAPGEIRASATLATNLNVSYDFGSYTAGAPAATGYVSVIIGGVSRKILIG